MNIPKKSRGFTLIELITVISIILILMGLLFPAITGIKELAKKAQAKNDVTNIVTAVKAFYTEYGCYPGTPTSVAAPLLFAGADPSNSNGALLAQLTGTSATTGTANTRGIVFIEVPSAKSTTAPKAGISGGIWYDPWGTPYCVGVDYSYVNQIPQSIHFYKDTTFNPVYSGVIAFSVGKDKLQGNKGDRYYISTAGANSDDVISWQ